MARLQSEVWQMRELALFTIHYSLFTAIRYAA